MIKTNLPTTSEIAIVALIAGIAASALNFLIGKVLCAEACNLNIIIRMLHEQFGQHFWLMSLWLLFAAPILESFVFITCVKLLRVRIRKYAGFTIAMAFALLHAAQHWVWGLMILPMFLLSAMIYEYYESADMRLAAFGVVLIHTVNNGISLVTIQKYWPLSIIS